MSDQTPSPAAYLFDGLLHFRHAHPGKSRDVLTAFVTFCATHMKASPAQLFQDLLVLFFTKSKKGGYFVEFGAADGIHYSNTWLLEKQFGWTGILAEPAKGWQVDLKVNRKAAVDLRCVWSESNQTLEFNEAPAPALSTLSVFSEKDFNRDNRQQGQKYLVDTISLNDLLAFHNSPAHIDYMSVDTEGSELAILEKFNFAKYDIGIMSVEHNWTPDREKIHDLLAGHGYVRVLEEISKCDDWYVSRAVLESKQADLPPSKG